MHVLVVEDNRTNLLVLKGIGSVAETISWDRCGAHVAFEHKLHVIALGPIDNRLP